MSSRLGNGQRQVVAGEENEQDRQGREGQEVGKMVHFYSLLGVGSPFDPTHRFATSWILSPRILLVYRVVLVSSEIPDVSTLL